MQLKKLIDAIKRRFKIRNEEAGSLIGVGFAILLLAALKRTLLFWALFP